jgi:hypothetical protein
MSGDEHENNIVKQDISEDQDLLLLQNYKFETLKVKYYIYMRR